MEIADFYPTPREMIVNEVETVKFFTRNPLIQAHVNFYGEAQKVFGQSSHNSRGFSFASYFDLHHRSMLGSRKRMDVNKPNVRLIISALVEQNENLSYGNISYVLAICRLQSKRSSILRKFHFDLSVTTGSRQPQPISHMQYCGEMIGVMNDLGYRETQLKQLHPKIREPRVFFSPMSLALLVDMALREFADDSFRSKFLGSPEWKNVIRANEELVLKKFYEKCFQIIDKGDRNRPTILDEFYRS